MIIFCLLLCSRKLRSIAREFEGQSLMWKIHRIFCGVISLLQVLAALNLIKEAVNVGMFKFFAITFFLIKVPFIQSYFLFLKCKGYMKQLYFLLQEKNTWVDFSWKPGLCERVKEKPIAFLWSNSEFLLEKGEETHQEDTTCLPCIIFFEKKSYTEKLQSYNYLHCAK